MGAGIWLRRGTVFGDLAMLYLFLGGTGAGAVATCCLLDLFVVKQPFDHVCYGADLNADPCHRTLNGAFLLGLLCLAAGTVCLMADVGRFDRILMLLTRPHLSVLTVGAYALAALLVLAGVLAAIRYLYVPSATRRMACILEAVAFAIALVTMAYTGVLLQNLGGIMFWRSPLLPVLFVLSSLSCGIALVLAAAPFASSEDRAQHRLLVQLSRCDMGIIVAEALCAAAFCLGASNWGHPATDVSLYSLLRGSSAAIWWLGFVACGLVAPFVVELLCSTGRRARTALAIAALLVLVGGACMRWAIVESGTYPALNLQTASAQPIQVDPRTIP